MRVPTRILRTAYHWPAALFSVVFTIVMVAAFVPSSTLQSVLLLAWAGGVVAVALGALEEPAVALLTLSTRAGPYERELLEPTAAMLSDAGVDLKLLRVRRVDSAHLAVYLGQRPWVVLSPRLLQAIREGWIASAEITALLIHAAGRHRLTDGHTHLAWLLSSAPWRGLAHAARGLGRALAWIPFGAISWRCRGLLAPICLIQSIAGGRTLLGIFTVLIIGLSYAVPAAERALSRRVDAAGDQAVAAQRQTLRPAAPETTQAHPSSEPPTTRPQLTLVRS